MSLRTSAAYIGVRVVAGAMAMASLALIVRGLGPAQYGHLTLGLAASGFVTQILFNPLNSMLARFYGEAAVRAPLLALLRTILVGCGVTLIVVASILDAIGIAPLAGHILLTAACMALAQGIFDFTGQYLAAAQQSMRYSAQFIGKACLTLLFAWLALRMGGGPETILCIMATAFLLSVIVGGGAGQWSLSLAPIVRAQWQLVTSFAGPLLLTSLLGYLLLWGDRYLLRQLVPIAELGRYSAMADLAQQTLGLIFSGLCTAWYPRIVMAWGSRDFAESQRLFSRYAALGLAVVLPVGAGFALMVPDVAPLMYGEAYTQISPALLPLVSAAAVIAAIKSYYFDVPLLLSKRVWRHSASIAGAALLSLFLAWLAVPVWGIAGAALGFFIGQTFGILFSYLAGRGVMHHHVPFALTWPPVAAVVLMTLTLLSWPVQSWGAILCKISGGAAVYCFVMLIADFDGVRRRIAGRLA